MLHPACIYSHTSLCLTLYSCQQMQYTHYYLQHYKCREMKLSEEMFTLFCFSMIPYSSYKIQYSSYKIYDDAVLVLYLCPQLWCRLIGIPPATLIDDKICNVGKWPDPLLPTLACRLYTSSFLLEPFQ